MANRTDRLPALLALFCLALLLTGCDRWLHPDGKFIPIDPGYKEVPDDRGLKQTTEELVFLDAAGTPWVAPMGTLTDGASVPQALLSITDGRFDNTFFKAAIVHDAYCQEDNKDVCPDQYRTLPWQDVHKMFYNACRACGTSETLASAMFGAVWLRGPKWDDPYYDLEPISEELLDLGVDGCTDYIVDSAVPPSVDQIVGWLEAREPALRKISAIETAWNMALDEEDAGTAVEALHRADDVLDRALAEHPGDSMLLKLRGTHHNNRAERLELLGRGEEAVTELDRAEKDFSAVREMRPADPTVDEGFARIHDLRQRPAIAEAEARRGFETRPAPPVTQPDPERIERQPVEPPAP